MTPPISVIVRAKDRAHTIRAALDSIRAQDTPAEIVVVDSGSTDGTLAIAREYADTVLEIPAGAFTYGGALNTGAEAAGAPVHVALSAHCELPDPGWLRRVLAFHEDPTVAATSGHIFGPAGERLRGPWRQEGDPALDRNPYWGYSNHAGSWRAEVWQRNPFATDLIACEDKEWAARVRREGLVVVSDPTLSVTSRHRRREGVRALFDRAVREAQAIAVITGSPPMTLQDIARSWWTCKEGRARLPQLLNPYQAIELAGRYVGERRTHPA
jgi:rhamnosyltransferase